MTGEFYALLSAVAFAVSTVYARRAMLEDPHGRPGVPPQVAVLASMGSNVLVFGLLTGLEATRHRLALLTLSSFALFLLGGVTATLVGRNLSYVSVLRIGSARSTALRLANTIFAVVIGLLAFRELPTTIQFVGAGLITMGLWFVITGPNTAASLRVDSLGILAAIGAAAAFAGGDSARRAALMITPSPFLGAAIGAGAAMLVQSFWLATRRLPRSGLDGVWRSDVLVSAVTSSGAILSLFLALQRTPVAVVGVLYNLQVLLVILLSRWVLPGDEEMRPRLVVGSVVCVLGTAATLLG